MIEISIVIIVGISSSSIRSQIFGYSQYPINRLQFFKTPMLRYDYLNADYLWLKNFDIDISIN